MEISEPHILATIELPFNSNRTFDLAKHETNCIAILDIIFGRHINQKILSERNHLWRYAQHYFLPEYPPFMRFIPDTIDQNDVNGQSNIDLPTLAKRMRFSETVIDEPNSSTSYNQRNQNISDEQILETCLEFLDLDIHFHQLWNWNKLLQLSNSTNKSWSISTSSQKAKWLFVECLGRLCPNLVEKKRAYLFEKLSQYKLGGTNEYDFIAVNKLLNGDHLKLPKSVEQYHQPKVNSSMICKEDHKPNTRLVEIQGESLLDYSINVKATGKAENIKLLIKDSNPFIEVNSHKNALSKIAKAVKQGRSVLLQGSIGCGKTKLVHHLAELTGHQDKIYQINMSDQLDGRALIGGYSCRDVPGQFQWEDGIATKAVEQGKWLLVEDADQAFRNRSGSDGGIAGILMTLIERKQLHLPSRGVVINAASDFQLFLTQRTTLNNTLETSHEDNMLVSLARVKDMIEVVQLYDHSEDDLRIIALKQAMFDEINPVISDFGTKDELAEKMVACFLALKERFDDKSTVSLSADTCKRTISLRDFLKWCIRCNEYSSNSGRSALTPEIIVLEAMDCFVNHLPPKSKERHDRVHGIGRMFQLLSNNIDRLLNLRVPTLTILSDQGCLSMGRVTLSTTNKSNKADILSQTSNRPFFLTASASKVLEFIAVAVKESQTKKAEPILLVGETGVGKTSVIQHLAGLVGRKLITVNLNQQTECSDLLGGYKPVDIQHFINPAREKFEILFSKTFSMQDNTKFLSHISTCYRNEQWQTILKLMIHVIPKAKAKCAQISDTHLNDEWDHFQTKVNKLLKNVSTISSGDKSNTIGNKLLFAFVNGVLAEAARKGEWILLDEINMAEAEVLECLSEVINTERDRFAVALTGQEGDIILKHPNFRIFACMNPATDIGKKQLPDGLRSRFTEYFIEEPLTKDELLPIVSDYLRRLHDFSEETKNLSEKIVKFYFEIKSLADKILIDGTGHKPTFSLRTLCRALAVAIDNLMPNNASVKSGPLSKDHIKRFLLEGFLMCFLTELDRQSYPIVVDLIFKHIGGGKKKSLALLSGKLPIPEKNASMKNGFVKIEGFWIQCGDEEPRVNESFILTSTVSQNLCDVVRVVSLSNHAVLLQGETSVGKTSLITYLGEATGNQVVRINNHEHTDIQEYVGSYEVNPETGSFTFVEGVLAKAMRNGHWIILDELNLAPSDVLEALNRVLDDNRELFIPETQTTIQASKNFRIFATQNPSGKYGGRKSLSRAFRNRFIELHFGELPSSEVAEIIHLHCKIDLKKSKKLVAVARELKMSRVNSGSGCDPNALLGKNLTLRDLFRWAHRCHSFEQTTKYYNWDQHFAQEGYLVLATKLRSIEDKKVVQHIIEKIFRCKIRLDKLFNISVDTISYTNSEENSKEPIVTIKSIDLIQRTLKKEREVNRNEIIWTNSAVRLAILILHSLEFKEPILLVGETGCGKTSIVSMVATLINSAIKTVNCHLNSETSDFLGCLRPTRSDEKSENRVPFKWVDGPLVELMKSGGILLVDEISLADDSVLERMNSVLEPSRTLTLVEGGTQERNDSIEDNNNWNKIKAHSDFNFIGTMNPGGDFGKKELSPALRNRLVEIWCPSPMDTKDDLEMLLSNMLLDIPNNESTYGTRENVISCILNFVEWFQTSKTKLGDRCVLSLRDIVGLVSFMNGFISFKEKTTLKIECSLVHGICLTIFDGLKSFVETESNVDLIKSEGKRVLQKDLTHSNHDINCDCYNWIMSSGGMHEVQNSKYCFRIGCFEYEKSKIDLDIENNLFSFKATTVACNMFKVMRGMQGSHKPILLEGTPGVGKTSSITALAQITGNKLIRINLSDQTEISDLFGSDLPNSEGLDGMASFSWQDGPFLAAIKAGHWILLDELNLATQSVLEGLNAALDHRGEIYLPELNRSFSISSDNHTNKTRIFGCQNPPRDGGQRKNLPKSFLNRFIKVYVNDYTAEDMVAICEERFPALADKSHGSLLSKIVSFVVQIQEEIEGKRPKQWGFMGSPWSFNLRDILRWCKGIEIAFQKLEKEFTTNSTSISTELGISLFTILRIAKLLFVERFRTQSDQKLVLSKLVNHFISSSVNANIEEMLLSDCPDLYISYDHIRIGLGDDRRSNIHSNISTQENMIMYSYERRTFESLILCTKHNWMPILVEENQSGRSGKMIHSLAKLYGQPLHTISLNSSSDTSELLGGFEQIGKFEILGKLLVKIQHQLQVDFNTSFRNQCAFDVGLHIINTKLYFDTLVNKSSMLFEVSGASECGSKTIAKEMIEVLEEYINFVREHGVDSGPFELLKKDALSLLKPDLQFEESAAQFDWVKSVLVNAMEKGHWLLIEDANRCNPSVLDRLNGLLEENGRLEIGEKGCSAEGNVSVVMPLTNFRLFFTMDPRHGELSPAMRNRGVEIHIGHFDNRMDNSSKEKHDISESQLQIAKMSYYSNAYIASRRFELMKRLQNINKQVFETAAIKAFLNSLVFEDNADYKQMWNVLKHLALIEENGFGVNLNEVVEKIETCLSNESWYEGEAQQKKRICLDTKTSMITEIAALKGVYSSCKTDAKFSTISMKHLWALIVQCLDQFICLVNLKVTPDHYHKFVKVKESLHTFEWIWQQAHMVSDSKSYEEELTMVWSIAWFQLKDQIIESLNIQMEIMKFGHQDTNQNSASEITQMIEEINQILSTQLQHTVLRVRRFWSHLGFVKGNLIDESYIENNRSILQASADIYLQKPSQLIQTYNHIKALIELHNIPFQKSSENWSNSYYTVFENLEKADNDIINRIRYNECEDVIANQRQLHQLIWLVQTTLLANYTISDENWQRYQCQNKNTQLKCGSLYPLSFKVLMQKLNQNDAWTFEQKRHFEIESDQIRKLMGAQLTLMENITGYKTLSSSLIQLMCINMSDVSVASHHLDESSMLHRKLSITNVPLISWIDRLNQLRAIHKQLVVGYEGEANHELNAGHNILPIALQNAIDNFLLITGSIEKSCLDEAEKTSHENGDIEKKTIGQDHSEIEHQHEPGSEYISTTKYKGYEDLTFLVSAPKRLLSVTKDMFSSTVTNILESCLNEIKSCLRLTDRDKISILTSTLEIYSGLLVFNASSIIGKIDLAEYMRHSANLVDFSINKSLIDIVAIDTCKALVTPKTFTELSMDEKSTMLLGNQKIEKIISYHPLQEEKRILLSGNMKSNADKRDLLLKDMPKRHKDESFKKLHEELEEFRRSKLMELDFFKDLQKELLHDHACNDIDSRFHMLRGKITTWEESVSKFTKHVRVHYSSFEDITLPILWGITMAMQGVETLLKRFEMRRYLPSKDNVINCMMNVRDCSTRLISSLSKYEFDCGIEPSIVDHKLEITRLLHHSWKANEEELGEENEEDTIIYKFNRDPDENVFENDTDCHLKQLSNKISTNIKIEKMLGAEDLCSSLSSIDFLKQYDELMSSIKSDIPEIRSFTSDYYGKDISYGMHCRALLEGIRVLSGTEFKFSLPASKSNKKEINLKWTAFCTDLQELQEFLREEICPYYPAEENSLVKDILQNMSAVLSRNVNEFLEKPNGFLVPIDKLIINCLEWNKNAPRNQLIPVKYIMNRTKLLRQSFCNWHSVTTECEEFLLEETREVAISALIARLESSICGKDEEVVNEYEEFIDDKEKRNSLCAPFILFFTSAFLGDFLARLTMVKQLANIYSKKDECTAAMIYGIYRYFAVYESNIKNALLVKKKDLRQKFEVVFRTGKLFEGDDKFTNHFKEANKFKRSYTVDYLKILKQPALHFCQTTNNDGNTVQEVPNISISRHLSTEQLSNQDKHFQAYISQILHITASTKTICSDVEPVKINRPFVSSKGTVIAENEKQMHTQSFRIATITSEGITSFFNELEETLNKSREKINVLHKELTEKKAVPCAFHPTQKSIHNICAEMNNEFGLKHQHGERYQLTASGLLAEIRMSEVLHSSQDRIGDSLLQAISNFDDFSGMILQSSIRGGQGDTRSLSASQKGYNTLSHGLIEIVRLASSKRLGLFENIALAFKVSTELKTCYRFLTSFNVSSVSTKEAFDWATTLITYLRKQEAFCNEIIATCEEVSCKPNSVSDKKNFFVKAIENGPSNNCDIKTDSIMSILSKYLLQICRMRQECSVILQSSSSKSYEHISNLKTMAFDVKEEYEKICHLLPHKGLGVLPVLFRQFHNEICNQITAVNQVMKNVKTLNLIDEKMSLQFFKKVRSTTEKCILAIQDTNIKVKKLREDPELKVSTKLSRYSLIRIVDLLLDIMKSLRLDQINTEIHIHTKFLKDAQYKMNMDISPIIEDFAENCAIFSDSYLSKLVIPTLKSIAQVLEKFGLYFGDAANVFKGFLKYKFPTKEKDEDNQKSEDSKNGESHDAKDGCGLGDDEGAGNAEATTKDIESEDIFDTAQKPGEEQSSEENSQKETKEEDGVEMSEGLENSELQNKDDDSTEDSDDSKSNHSDEEEQMDVEEGKTEEGNELLDEDVWNDDEKDEEKETEEQGSNKERDNNSSSQVQDQKGIDEEDSDPNDVDDTGNENKRKREDEQQNDGEGEEEVEMNDPFYREEDFQNEPEEMPDMSEMDENGINDELGDDESGEEDMENDIIEQKLPDFEDDKKDEECPELDKPSDDLTNTEEQAAGHDRNNASNSMEKEESDKKPEKSDNLDQKSDETKGTQNDGLLDENATQKNNNEAGNDNVEEIENEIDNIEETNDDSAEEKFMESTDCAGVQKLQIVNNAKEEDDRKVPKAPKIFEHVPDREDDCIKTVDRVDEKDQLNKKPNLAENNENEDVPMNSEDHDLENSRNVVIDFNEDDMIQTSGPQRGADEMIIGETKTDGALGSASKMQMSSTLATQYRHHVQDSCNENVTEWLNICGRTRNLSSSLTEQLRLILEPTKATKFKGDFRTGKRLNMRKIIPYIASGFRKDRIWLRRTKPSAREYQVILALDDSSSMRDNAVRKTAYNSLAIICQALSTLDVGKFGILGFGNEAKMVQPLQSNFCPEDGAHILNTFTFEQSSTNVASMLLTARKAFSDCAFSSNNTFIFEKLLIIVSDGRGIFNEGKETVLESVRSAKMEGIFIIFLIIENLGAGEDNNKAKDSILDIRIASFDSSGIPTVVPYMEEFPFSNYVILRNVESLPQGLSDALRQWFSMVASNS